MGRREAAQQGQSSHASLSGFQLEVYGLEKSCLLIKVRVSKKATHKQWRIQNRKDHFIRYPVPVI